jgi:HEAT repeat protein
LASLYLKSINDPSYAVIKAAALALADTKSPEAYAALVKLLGQSSWRDNIRASALAGLGELRDKRSLDVALRYATAGNANQARAAALRLLGRIGNEEPWAFKLIAETAGKAFESGDYDLATAAGDALVSLGDPKGLSILEQIGRNNVISRRLKARLGEYQEALRKSVAGTASQGTQHP